MKQLSTLELLGAYSGLVGGLTGLAGFGFQVWFHTSTGPRVKVRLEWAINLADERRSANPIVINSGRLATTIESVSVEYSNRNHSPLSLFYPGTVQGKQLPMRLESHAAISWLLDLEAVQEAVKNLQVQNKIRIKVVTETGKEVRSKWVAVPE